MPRPLRVVSSFVTRLVVVALLVISAGTPGPAASVRYPQKPRLFPQAIEAYAPYHPQVYCLPYTRVGTKGLGDLLVHAYPGTTYGTVRPCGTIGAKTTTTSEHYDGRVLDWMVSVRNPTQKAEGDAFLAWLLADDRWGN